MELSTLAPLPPALHESHPQASMQAAWEGERERGRKCLGSSLLGTCGLLPLSSLLPDLAGLLLWQQAIFSKERWSHLRFLTSHPLLNLLLSPLPSSPPTSPERTHGLQLSSSVDSFGSQADIMDIVHIGPCTRKGPCLVKHSTVAVLVV